MSNQRDDQQIVGNAIKKLRHIEEGYLGIIENTLKTVKEQKKEDIYYLDSIEHLLENYKKELEYLDQKNKEIYNNIIKLIENKKYMCNEVREDLKKTDKHIQLIQIQKEL